MKIAVVMCGFGGVNNVRDIKRFTFNAMYDRSMLDLPNPLRYVCARIIAIQQSKLLKKYYLRVGGGLPLLEITTQQAKLLEEMLTAACKNITFKVFVAMRYWHPFISETAPEIKRFNPDRTIILPVYPQCSGTMMRSMLKEWQKQSKQHALPLETNALVCCFSRHALFAKACAELIKPVYEASRKEHDRVRIVFIAHGLPRSVVKKGDPYEWQVHETIRAIIDEVNEQNFLWSLGYCSRFRHGKWLAPSLESIVENAAMSKEALVIVPISFIASGFETAYIVDVFCKKLFYDNGGRGFYSIPPFNTDVRMIDILTDLVLAEINRKSFPEKKTCALKFQGCMYDYKF